MNTDVLERIKSLEISLKQHRDVEEQLRRTLQSTRQEHNAFKQKRASAVESWEAKQEAKMSEKNLLQAEMHRVAGEINNWKELATKWKQDLSEKAREKAALEATFREQIENRANIIQDRDATEAKDLQHLVRTERNLKKEHKSNQDLIKDASKVSVALDETFSRRAIKEQEKELKKLDRLIAELEAQIDEKKRSMEIDETNAAELVSTVACPKHSSLRPLLSSLV